MLLAAIDAKNILAIQQLGDRIINWIALAQPAIASLLVFAVVLHLVGKTSNLITKSSAFKNRFLGRAAYLSVLVLFALLATLVLQPIWSTNIVSISTARVEVASSRDYQKNVSLGQRNVALGGGGYVTGIYFHPLQQDLIYIKTDVGGFYRWNPANKSWIPITEQFRFDQSDYYGGEALALDPNNPNLVYIAVGKYWAKPGAIFKSTDRGATWTKLNLSVPMGGNEPKRWVGERLAVNPFDSNVIFFGSRLDGLWKSSDAGATWTKVTSFPGTPTKAIGITGIVFDTHVSGLVYANAYGDGIYKSTDTGITWSKIQASPNTAMRLTVASNSTLYVTSATSPGVSKYTNGTWSDITPNNSKDVFNGLSINQANPNDVLVSLGETTSTKIYRSLDGGTTWTQKTRVINNTVPWWNGILLSQPWVSAIEFDPKVAGRSWLTDWYGIWQTEDINANPVVWTNYQQGHEETGIFTLVSPPSGSLLLSGMADVDGFNHNNGLDAYPSKTFSGSDSKFTPLNNYTISYGSSGPSFQDTYSIAYSESDPSRMVRVGGNRWNNKYSGATSKDGGLTWKQFASFPADTMPLRVAISPTNQNLFVVTVSGGQALYTSDGGASWRKVSGLPNGAEGPWNTSQPLAADKVDSNTFYYYANGKVYRSTNGGSSFEIVNSSLPSDDWYSLKTVPGVKGEVWVSVDEQGLYYSTNGGTTFSKIAGVERSHLFAFGKPPIGSTISALYVYGKITDMAEGIFRSLDQGKTWTSFGDPHKPIGAQPNVMEASRQEFGLIFIGTGGRGIYYGTQ